MSDKNFVAYGDAETVLTGFATDIKAKQPKTLETPITIEGVQKTTVESALQGLVGSVADGKALVASAITNKGVQTASNATFQTMANNIGQIPGIPSCSIYVDKFTIGGASNAGGSFIMIPYEYYNQYITKIKATVIDSNVNVGSTGTVGYLGKCTLQYNADGGSYYFTPPSGSVARIQISGNQTAVGTVWEATFSKNNASKISSHSWGIGGTIVNTILSQKITVKLEITIEP